nr:uncharacterized protein LOC109189720 [Ipomoea trifida]
MATKLTGDLTSPMWSPQDNIAKITSTAFLTMFLGNIFITLGSMNNADILANLTALSILVITVFVDLCIQLSTGALDYSLFPEIIYAIILLFCMLLTIASSALAVPAIKKHAELVYQKMLASDKEHMERQQQTVEELRLSITKYWVMAVSGSPQFLMKSGVVEFDSNRVPSLLSDEPSNCWTLPVVTLTSIAVALPNIAIQHIDWLVTSVDEGLHYASIIDVLDEKCGLKSIKSVADVWVGVELHKKWFDMNLERKIGEVRSAKEIILALANEAERVVMEFSSTKNRIIVESPLYWPSNILAANSMYRISRTILLHYKNSECQVEELFRKLICMIADILTACLTNLPHLIATKCICNAIEKREKSVRDAAIILGETEDILKCFEKRKLSNMGPRQPLCIDECRQWIERHAPTISTSATSNGGASSDDESSKPVVIQMQA